ncbi:choice-of-anchor V domain-containing protein [Rubrivirga sp. IMCC43871]|uniref:choice-of-anchor V domain-containing protein n=1 Tax=Rubrivirga sp. IMCC43871 TaxID=3391575 RepID=UPI00398FF2E1
MTLRPTLLLATLSIAALGIVVGAPGMAVANSSGSNPGFAGNLTRGDGSPQTCNVCHSTADLNTGSGSVVIDAPAAATSADVVRITVTVDNQTDPATAGSRRQGFQATVRDPADPSGSVWGTLALVDAASTRFSGSAEAYVTHTAGGTGQTTWQFDWTPGGERVGAARIYVVGNAADGNGGSSGDLIYTQTADVLVTPVAADDGPDAARLGTAHPNPARRGTAVRFDAVGLGEATARVIDATGRTIGTVPVGTGALVVDTEALAPGAYTLVVDGATRRTRALAVVR